MFSKKEEVAQPDPVAEPEFPKKGQNGGGSEEAYSVEARYMYAPCILHKGAGQARRTPILGVRG